MVLTFYSRLAHQLALGAVSSSKAAKATKVPFMCWPVDTAESMFDHMNNTNFLKFAELSRWRMMAESGLLRRMIKEKMNLIIAEQTITYAKPIRNFQKFNVTTIVSAAEDKWLCFDHSFEDSAKGTTLASVKVKAVLKAGSGKTCRPSEVVAASPYFKDLLS